MVSFVMIREVMLTRPWAWPTKYSWCPTAVTYLLLSGPQTSGTGIAYQLDTNAEPRAPP